MRNVYWRKAGPDMPLLLVVIKPLGYRLRKGSKLLYRQPAFLICTDPQRTCRSSSKPTSTAGRSNAIIVTKSHSSAWHKAKCGTPWPSPACPSFR